MECYGGKQMLACEVITYRDDGGGLKKGISFGVHLHIL